MKTSDFYYDLPEGLIAQSPAKKRDKSRLLALDRQSGSIKDGHFSEIIDYLKPNDCLVLNDTKVFKARLVGKKPTGAEVELFLLRALGSDKWEALLKPGKRMKPGATAFFGDGFLSCEVLNDLGDGIKEVQLSYSGDFDLILDKLGEMPLPPYIKKKLSREDEGRYQTVYARDLGSVAAPTAGLHFTEDLMDKIREKGINIAKLTLHVGIGTFRPVKVEDISKHIMHSERYEIGEDCVNTINASKAAGGRIISVGTTTTRVLESVATKEGYLKADSGETDIFISPGYDFKVVDALITNFHLPESTLLMLVSAFYNREAVLEAYERAVKMEYRFFSFGDSMFIY